MIIEEADNALMTVVTTDDQEGIVIGNDGIKTFPALRFQSNKSGFWQSESTMTIQYGATGKGIMLNATHLRPTTEAFNAGFSLGGAGKPFEQVFTTNLKLDAANNQRNVTLKAPDALGASYSLEFPADDGSNNEVLITNGSGVLSWGTVNTANITADAIDATKIADDAISEEHLDPTVISALTAATPVAGDYVMILDADDGALKKALVEEVGPLSRPEAPGTPNSSSDRRFKKNISTVSGALQKLSKLNPVNYDWRQDEFEHKGFGDKKQWGFIAQEIKEIFPELVGKDDEDFLTLNYQGFVPLLTKAVQEQQEEIDSQQKEIDALKSQLQMIMDMLDNDMSDKTDSKKDNDNKKPVKLSMATQK